MGEVQPAAVVRVRRGGKCAGDVRLLIGADGGFLERR